MLSKSEKNILRFIKYIPIIFIFILSIVISYFLMIENKNKLNEDIKQLKKEYYSIHKEYVKTEVNRIYKYIKYQKQTSEEDLKKQLKQRVYEAHKIASNIYKENKNKNKSEILKLIKDALRDIRFNKGRGYYFIHNIKGQNLLYPLERSVEGTNYSNLQDMKGYYFVRKIMETIKNKGENFDIYYWNTPYDDPYDTANRIYKKIAFYKYFEPLNISIGTGDYLENFESILKEDVLDYISNIVYNEHGYTFIITGKKKILTNKKEKRYFQKYSENLKRYINQNKTKDTYFIADDKTTTYVKHFKDWNWIIGSSFYTNNLNLKIEKKTMELDEYHRNYLLNIFFIITTITIILLIISIYLSNEIQNRFLKYRNRIFTEVEKNRKKDYILAQQSKMAAMGEMIGNIAHQWRQPLSLISTASSALKLKQELDDLKEEEIIEISTKITNATKHLSKTIDDFRNFFRPNKEKTLINTNILWEKIENLIKNQYTHKNIEIIIDIENIQLKVLENELIQVMLNILNNSRDELLKDENLDKKLIFVKMRKEKDFLNINIKDNAGGIPKDIINRVFEPYFTTKHKSQGTGIGLYMSEEIIKKHMKGSIKVQNNSFVYKEESYSGALFKITIPL